jgi:hypothetical protein
MESATLDPELFEQRVELAFPYEIRIPRRSVARGKEQPKPVRFPGAKVRGYAEGNFRIGDNPCRVIIGKNGSRGPPFSFKR